MWNKNQIWVETVIYTLIGLAIIGVLLSLVQPAIEEKKDQLLLQQSIEMLNNIYGEIDEITFYGSGNSRALDIAIKKGKLEINSEKEIIEFYMESKHQFSELNQTVNIGKIEALTKKRMKTYDVSLKINYTGKLNLTWSGKDIKQTLQASPTAYGIIIKNLGKNNSNFLQIDFSGS